MSVLLLLAPVAPLAAWPLLAVRRLVRPALLAAVLAPLPALAAAVLAPAGDLALPWLLLGGGMRMDDTARAFLTLTVVLYAAGGLYAGFHLRDEAARRRFFAFWLPALAGNLALVLAADLATFYLGFALMTFSAYGLVVHAGDAEARRAGRVYLVLAVVGEALLLAGFVHAGRLAGDVDLVAVRAALPGEGVVTALLVMGFGVKAGLVPLHVWLPLAHPVAPTPASAVLSGAMIKAGLLGWIRFLPVGEEAAGGLATALLVVGLGAAVLAVVVGLTQRDAKTILAYSSISQMGLMTAGLAVALAGPAAAPAALGALGFFALHHGLAKAALFLGVGVAGAGLGRRWRAWATVAGLALPALALAGAPFTSGVLAKEAVTGAARALPGGWYDVAAVAFPVTSVATAVLMGRLGLVVLPAAARAAGPPAGPGLWGPWAALVSASAVSPWAAPAVLEFAGVEAWAPDAAGAWAAAWPIAAGAILLAAGLAAVRRRPAAARVRVPAGDLLVPAEAGLRAIRAAGGRVGDGLGGARGRVGERLASASPGSRARSLGAALERGTERWSTGGLSLLALAVVGFALLWAAGVSP